MIPRLRKIFIDLELFMEIFPCFVGWWFRDVRFLEHWFVFEAKYLFVRVFHAQVNEDSHLFIRFRLMVFMSSCSIQIKNGFVSVRDSVFDNINILAFQVL